MLDTDPGSMNDPNFFTVTYSGNVAAEVAHLPR